MRHWKLLIVVLGLVATACAGDTGADGTTTTPPAETTTTTEAPAAPEAPAPALLIWADENRARVLNEVAPAFTEATGVPVEVQVVDFGDIRDQVKTAGPAGEGPDLFVGAHDWTGELVVAGVVDPIDLSGKVGDFVEVALDAFSFDGQLYAVPYATEAIAVYYNADLVSEAPASMEEIKVICDGLEGIENCFGVPGGGEGPDAYHNYPFLSAFGGYIFRFDGGFDPSDVGLDSEGAIAGATYLASLVSDGYIDPTGYDTAKELFLDGRQPFWMTGPWELGTMRDSDLNWGVTTLPTLDGNTPQPFVGAQGFFLSAFSESKVVAQSFLLDFLASGETMRALYDIDPRIPAYISTLEELAADPVVEVFGESIASGVPMPNIPQMGAVWGPLGDALLEIRNGTAEPEAAMRGAAEQVRAAVAD